MLIPDQLPVIRYTYTGINVFQIPYPFYGKTSINIQVETGTVSSPVPVTLIYGTDYSVDGVPAPTNDGTETYMNGEATLTASGIAKLTYGNIIAVFRSTDPVQDYQYNELDSFPAKSHENALGRAIVLIQELKEELNRTIKQSITDGRPPMTAEDFFAMVEKAIEDALSELNRLVDKAEAAADRAEAAADVSELAASLRNVRKAWNTEEDIPDGGVLTLPGGYFPTRNTLLLFFDSAPCEPRTADVEISGEYQYTEIGNDPDAYSTQVTVHFAIPAGSRMDMFVVASNAGRNLEIIEEAQQQVSADKAEVTELAEQVSSDADRAEAARTALPELDAASPGQILTVVQDGGVKGYGFINPPSGGGVIRQDTVVATTIPAGSIFTVPSYTVGGNRLSVYLDGVLGSVNSLEAPGFYEENGANGDTSTTITIIDVVNVDQEITAIATF